MGSRDERFAEYGIVGMAHLADLSVPIGKAQAERAGAVTSKL
jgi:hypothetical protein